jgi:hypothetical protein
MLLSSVLENDHNDMADVDDEEEREYSLGLWWLEIGPPSSRLLLVHTCGVTEGLDYRSYDDYRVADNVADHHGRTIATYTTGLAARCSPWTLASYQFH